MPSPDQGFDTRNFERELGRIFGEYRVFNQRSLPILLEQLGSKLCVDAYLEAAKLRDSQKAKIDAVPLQHGYAVRRRQIGDLFQANEFKRFKKGKNKGQFRLHSVRAESVRNAAYQGHKHVSIEDEIRLRKRFAALYQASGWLSEITKQLTHPFKMKYGAIVVKKLAGTALSIHIENPRTNSAEFANSTGYLQRAFQNRIADMRVYIQRKLNADAVALSGPRPTFGDPRAAVEQAMAGAFKQAA